MSPSKVRVFFYASLMDPDEVRRYGGTPSPGLAARLAGWRPCFVPWLSLEPDPAREVWGVLCEMRPEELDRIYSAPPIKPFRYVPRNVSLDAPGGATAAVVYISELETRATPEAAYLQKLEALVRKRGFPESYRRALSEG